MKQTLCTSERLKNLRDRLQRENQIRKKKTDEELFLEAMADVKEIRKFREIPYKSPKKINCCLKPPLNDTEVLRQIVSGKRKITLSDTGEYIEWTSPQTRRDLTRRLHRGEFSVQDCIDLHGMTLREAEDALQMFFRTAALNRLFCVKVIHGRGLRSPNGPVLKEGLRVWLQTSLRKYCLAYATARDCDGGLGATYVILKS
ncbi:MAG: Smr/MutS family protein [Dissulfurispiraceae bacterium]